MINIVLVNPKIPQNTGTIGRTAVLIGATLHIIKPIPFSLDEKRIKRAGLDYWKSLDLKVWENIEEFLDVHPLNKRCFFATTKTTQLYFDIKFNKGDFIFFGSEDSGLPQSLMDKLPQNKITIPMKKGFRSLNLSNAVSVIAYEALRQNLKIK